jgi:hypothetical protein
LTAFVHQVIWLLAVPSWAAAKLPIQGSMAKRGASELGAISTLPLTALGVAAGERVGV